MLPKTASIAARPLLSSTFSYSVIGVMDRTRMEKLESVRDVRWGSFRFNKSASSKQVSPPALKNNYYPVTNAPCGYLLPTKV